MINAPSWMGVIEDASALTEQITASINEISTGIDEQATAMDEVAHRAQRLSAMSDDVTERVDQFKLSRDETAELNVN